MDDQVVAVPAPGGGGTQSPGPPAGRQAHLNGLVSAVCAPGMSLSGPDGQIRPQGAEGLYVQDLRALSQLVMVVGGAEPIPLSHDLVGGARNEFQAMVVVPGDQGPDPRVLVRRQRTLGADGMTERFTIRSYAPPALRSRVELKLGSDLAGIATVKAGRRPAPLAASATDDGLAWELPGRCSVRAAGFPKPDVSDPLSGSMAWDITVEAGQAVTLSVAVELREQGTALPVEAAPRADAELTSLGVLAADPRLCRFVQLSLADLNGLRMVVPPNREDVFVAAGAPWYLTLFGRDSIWAARMLLPLGTKLALGTLRTLARRQGRSFDSGTGEQPGKILHEVRRESTYDNETSGRVGTHAFSLPPVYYGTVDATPLWVCLLHEAWKWGAPESEVEPLLAPMQSCLAWLAECASGPDGFVSYIDQSGQGLANQGWKDSSDSIQFRDGRLARAPIALCEVQGYAYQAAMAGAELLDSFGTPGAERWREFAGRLAHRFRARFWVEDPQGPYPVIALEADGTPVDSLSSNIGHLPGTGLLSADESELVARRLQGPELNSGFGLRTLSTSCKGFNPLSYHRGSVWAHDTAIAVAGLARTHGPVARQAAASLIEGLLSAAEGFDYRLPELYGGEDRAGRRAPMPYPASCHPQAWAAASSIVILTALLGIQPDVPGGSLAFAPLASTGLRRVDGFRVGESNIAVQVHPDGRLAVTGAPAGVQVPD